VFIDGDEMTIYMADVPDQSCLAITLLAIADLDGHPLAGDNDVHLVSLYGDVNADGIVDDADEAETLGQIGQPVDETNARCDVDASNAIDSDDVTAIDGQNGHAADCQDMPRLLAAASRRTHPGAGELDIDLPPGPPEEAGIEPRQGGLNRLVLTFSEPVRALDGRLDATEIGLTCRGFPCGNVDAVSILGEVMIVDLSGLPDRTCAAITLSGITDADHLPLSGDRDVHVAVLCGDTNADGRTNAIDMSQVRAMNGQPLVAATCRFDVNMDGAINVIDAALVRSLYGGAATCP